MRRRIASPSATSANPAAAACDKHAFNYDKRAFNLGDKRDKSVSTWGDTHAFNHLLRSGTNIRPSCARGSLRRPPPRRIPLRPPAGDNREFTYLLRAFTHLLRPFTYLLRGVLMCYVRFPICYVRLMICHVHLLDCYVRFIYLLSLLIRYCPKPTFPTG